ncbi:hypothetical protein CBS63078_11019 [Aspergillus niger]|nr:hypothetical protein CBS12448_6927 [Aspergillus niger]KAI2886259.1 hypothetical protein CBS63078_11019 [Aspergillus niger]KAI2922431.1 hypothetical protein CBS147371_2003 [Aspergillus niger]KAI2952746.1 hypothetical protein CBS147322_4462 [Aspergillus niger]KAI2961910.1 hypothetical protein CBS147323_7687 [Aspergillus niger]
MQSFTLPLPNNATVAGIHSIPDPNTSLRRRPLIVALHGGTYDCHYFDGTPDCSASRASIAFGVPFVSIDRPCVGGTSSFLPVPEGSNFNQETGRWLHSYILPALWSKFGGGCNCIVLLCHSLGVMGGTVAAAMHAQDEKPRYPLGGLIASGMGDKLAPSANSSPPVYEKVSSDYVSMPADVKDRIMFKPGTCSSEVLAHSDRLNAAMPLVELQQFPTIWLPTWREDWAKHVVAPVMFALVEDDVFFEASEEETRSCTAAFANSVRVDGSLVKGAPHCMELSYWSQGWYARCFGFALECSASLSAVCEVTQEA